MIDANILLDWLLDRDTARTLRIDRLFLTKTKFHVADLAIVEIVFALEKVYQLPRDIVAMNVSKIIESEHLSCNQILFAPAISDYVRHPSLSIVDCCLLRYAELQNNLPLWTFDKKLVNQSAGRAKIIK